MQGREKCERIFLSLSLRKTQESELKKFSVVHDLGGPSNVCYFFHFGMH